MVQSRSEIPSFDVSVEVDVTTVLELRRGVAELIEIVPSVNDFVVKAVALTLREFPASTALSSTDTSSVMAGSTSGSRSRPRTHCSFPR